MDKNVCAYYRTSSNTNVGNDKDSKKRQQHSVKTYTQSKGLNVVNEFYDKGVSGTLDVLNRPSFMEMLNYCEENKVSTIVFESACRMSRDLITMETGFQYLTSLGYKLISVSNPDTFIEDTPTSTMIRQVLGVISQFEKSNLVLKLKGARDRKSKLNKSKGIIDRNGNGKCAGKKRLSEKHPVLSKMVVNYRKMIDTKTHQPLSYRTISRRLKEEDNLVVSHNTVHRIFDDVVFMKKEDRNRRRRKRIETA
jgi:DNA invertase Pin-like site-specific DNA recombinase